MEIVFDLARSALISALKVIPSIQVQNRVTLEIRNFPYWHLSTKGGGDVCLEKEESFIVIRDDKFTCYVTL